MLQLIWDSLGIKFIILISMINKKTSILFLHLKTQLKDKRHTFQIVPQTKFVEIQQKVKELYKIKDNPFDMFIHQNGRQILLDEQTFEYFKGIAHFNKIIKVVEYNHLTQTFIQVNQHTNKQIEVNKADLQQIQLEADCYNHSSFLADGFSKLVPVLNTICSIVPENIYNQQEKLSLQLINSIQLNNTHIIQDFAQKILRNAKPA